LSEDGAVLSPSVDLGGGGARSATIRLLRRRRAHILDRVRLPADNKKLATGFPSPPVVELLLVSLIASGTVVGMSESREHQSNTSAPAALATNGFS